MDASYGRLGTSGALLEYLGAFKRRFVASWGRLWGVLESLGRAVEASCGRPGGVLGFLEPSCGRLGDVIL